MIRKVKDTIARCAMLQHGDCVAVGLSGGADSVSLLSVLLELRELFGITVRAIHIDHGIRGESARADRLFCADLCRRLDVELDIIELDVPTVAAQLGIGLEECGRRCRYEHFARIAQEHSCIIATAHTLSDSAETVIFNLARGSALGGVCGIPPVRQIPLQNGQPPVTVIRPLIGVTREEVEDYCSRRGLIYVTDETNSDTVYRRNLIRSRVIPALREVNPAFHPAVERFSRCASEDDAYLENLAQDALNGAVIDGVWSADALAALAPPLLRRAVSAIADRAGCRPEYTQVILCCEAVKRGSGAVMLTDGVRFSVNRGIVTVDSGRAPAPEDPWEVTACFPVTSLPDGRTLFFEQIALNDTFSTQKHQKLLFKNALSCDIIKDNISVRNRREGDRFAPAGRGVTRKLKKLLCDEGVPAHLRGKLALVVSEQGILWAENFGASELQRPSPDDRQIIVPNISGKE